jgi:hypothetical protein
MGRPFEHFLQSWSQEHLFLTLFQMNEHVSLQVCAPVKPLATLLTLKWPYICMEPHVHIHVTLSTECFPTNRTLERPFASVYSFMYF